MPRGKFHLIVQPQLVANSTLKGIPVFFLGKQHRDSDRRNVTDIATGWRRGCIRKGKGQWESTSRYIVTNLLVRIHLSVVFCRVCCPYWLLFICTGLRHTAYFLGGGPSRTRYCRGIDLYIDQWGWIIVDLGKSKAKSRKLILIRKTRVEVCPFFLFRLIQSLVVCYQESLYLCICVSFSRVQNEINSMISHSG